LPETSPIPFPRHRSAWPATSATASARATSPSETDIPTGASARR